ncbi:hypothetical protein BS50DRAFT_501516 [Corynespora cassiicola Philippines]|uniref:RING-type E3 ubiquitin transferase n=1 Tax=Corynespora cassiicola Philippines TaxID=1448308 RepID=A0A2T2NBS3_CORCC|nr:hypothetical protein BS50DRAFT_501516 [Corynespora cassiicola Philippines]
MRSDLLFIQPSKYLVETSAGPDKDDSEDTCVICLSPVTERAITVPCNHWTFDFICLVSWLQERSACPLCKTDVTAVQYDWVSPSDFKTYHVRSTIPSSSSSSTSRSYGRHSRLALPRRPPRPRSPPRRDIALMHRRYVYRYKLYSFHVGSNRHSQYQEVTPRDIASSPHLQYKAKAWIRRELRVFGFLHSDPAGGPVTGVTTSGNLEVLLSYILAIVKKVDLKASNGHAENLIAESLGRENARLFLHELNAFMRSPYTRPEEWDRNVEYTHLLPHDFDDQGRPLWRKELLRNIRET